MHSTITSASVATSGTLTTPHVDMADAGWLGVSGQFTDGTSGNVTVAIQVSNDAVSWVTPSSGTWSFTIAATTGAKADGRAIQATGIGGGTSAVQHRWPGFRYARAVLTNGAGATITAVTLSICAN